MATSMLSKVVTTHESSVTNRADKLFLTGVCSPVAGKLIRAGKFFLTAFPVAAEGLLAYRKQNGKDH